MNKDAPLKPPSFSEKEAKTKAPALTQPLFIL